MKLLVVSDMHFGKLAASPEFAAPGSGPLHPIQAAVPMKENLIETVKRIGPAPEVFLILGDLTSIASPSEFQGSVAVVRDIAQAVGIREDMVLFTLGNHDVDWRVCSLASATGQFPKDELYNRVGAGVGGLFVSNPAGFEEGPLPYSGVLVHDRFTLFVLNSGYFCVSDQEYRHGKLGQDQVKWLEAALKKNAEAPAWRILMVHHHPFNYPYPTLSMDVSTLEEGAELVELAGRHGIDVVCHGHRHHPKLSTQMRAAWTKPVTYFCAGSLAVNETQRNNGQIPNLFHVVSLDSRLPNGGALGYVQTFEYAASEGWRPISHSKETPLDHIQYFGALPTAPELRRFSEEFVRACTGQAAGRGGGTVMLPSHANLPPELKCQPFKDLNRLLQDAAREAGCKAVGCYPNDVALMPN